MSMKEFNVQIKLGNAEMLEPAHVAEALRDLAERLENRSKLELRDSFGIRDINGNQVGSATIDRVGVKGQRHSPAFDSATRKVSGVEARQAVIQIAALYGGFSEWDNDSMAEDVAGILNELDLPAVSDGGDDDLDFWADVAEELGYEPDRPDREDDGDPDAQMDAREDGM